MFGAVRYKRHSRKSAGKHHTKPHVKAAGKRKSKKSKSRKSKKSKKSGSRHRRRH